MTDEGFIPEHLILPQDAVPLCEDSHLRTAVLATLPTLDDGGLTARQTGGDPNRGIRIPGASGEQSFLKLITPANRNLCGIETIRLAKTSPL